MKIEFRAHKLNSLRKARERECTTITMALMQYINGLNAQINNKDGEKMASLISLKSFIAGGGNTALENAAKRV